MIELTQLQIKVDELKKAIKDVVFSNSSVEVKVNGDASDQNRVFIHIRDPLNRTSNGIVLEVERNSGKIWTVKNRHNLMVRLPGKL